MKKNVIIAYTVGTGVYTTWDGGRDEAADEGQMGQTERCTAIQEHHMVLEINSSLSLS